jgi:hypothetical protein
MSFRILVGLHSRLVTIKHFLAINISKIFEELLFWLHFPEYQTTKVIETEF